MRRHLLAALAVLAFAAMPARAQEFPGREVRLICPFSPGGTCDLLTRMLAEYLQPIFGVPVVVENRTGASGMIGADLVAKSPPDGHAAVLATMGIMTILPEMPGVRMPFDPDRDLTPITNVVNVYNILVAAPNAPFDTVSGLIEYARANPGRLSYASAGNGSSQHLAGELFKRLAGVDLLHVPYRGGAPAIIDIVAGRTTMMFGNLPEFMGQIRGGGLRPIAYGAPRQSPLLPDLPLIRDTLPEFAIRNWFGLAAAPNLPRPVRDRWVEAMRRVDANPDFRRRLAENGMESLIEGPEAFRAIIAEDRRRWGEVIRAAGIRAD
ncbi:Bug family tripartite tricarboxylate transporter substrate binding protein [Crenalkalicoccus roseus]|uniref:Bug family tripartite tricarboxylate transporter substrate binding protein n=1 Tax=Crenalkalicoccus roseus TaxID=1485588 RepID=UPI00108124A3|nr:tripartite tricarboxylate transporter substrate binding protein [Crenalkalicoccus roseus]